MRFLIWMCRVFMVVVVAAFVATVFYMTHDVGNSMDRVGPALDLVTVIGAGLVGLLWSLMRRYWQAFILLVAVGVFRGFFGMPGLSSLKTELVTSFQEDYLWVSMGVVALALVVTLVARAITSDRKLQALKQTPPRIAPKLDMAPAVAITSAAPVALEVAVATEPAVAPPVSLGYSEVEAAPAPAPEAVQAESTEETTKGRRKK